MLQLSNGRVIPNALRAVTAKFERFSWHWYDGVQSDPDAIEPVDYAITIAMNSRATADRMKQFMELGPTLNNLLRAIPHDTTLATDTSDDVFHAVEMLFDKACSAKGTKLSVASKVLHRKRPHLIPMLDSVVVNRHYWPALNAHAPSWFEPSWLTTGASSDPTQYMRVMADELDANREELARIRADLPKGIPASISDVRLLEAALYAQLLTSE